MPDEIWWRKWKSLDLRGAEPGAGLFLWLSILNYFFTPYTFLYTYRKEEAAMPFSVVCASREIHMGTLPVTIIFNVCFPAMYSDTIINSKNGVPTIFHDSLFQYLLILPTATTAFFTLIWYGFFLSLWLRLCLWHMHFRDRHGTWRLAKVLRI